MMNAPLSGSRRMVLVALLTLWAAAASANATKPPETQPPETHQSAPDNAAQSAEAESDTTKKAEQTAVGATLPGITLPAVETRPAQADTDSNQTAPAATSIDKKTIEVVPGVNYVVPISKGHLNRIITPFADPVVHTTSSAQISTQGSVLYVASSVSGPTTMYISPDGNQHVALSLTLVPKAIPPRAVTLSVKSDSGRVWSSSVRAGEWEQARPYVQTLKKVMRQLALGQIPPGYGLHAWQKGDPRMTCAQLGLKVEAGQILTGSNLIALVGVATNVADRRLEINEASCRHSSVLAVAAWPDAILGPGDQTELYIIMQRPEPGHETRVRPSLLAASETDHG